MFETLNLYSHGYVLLPVLGSFYKHNIFRCIKSHPNNTIKEINNLLGANEGHLRVALRLFQSLDWLDIDEHEKIILKSSYCFEEIQLLDNYLDLYQDNILETLLSKHALIHSWFDFSRKNQTCYSQQLSDILDGPLMVPLLLSLDQKKY